MSPTLSPVRVPNVVADSLTIRPLADQLVESLGHDPRSSYVETYWLGILGPSTTWLLRRLVAGLDRTPEGYELSLSETARSLGLGDKGGRHSPFMRALTRLVQFEIAEPRGRELAVRRKLPPLNRRQIIRMPASLQASHAAFLETDSRRPPFEQVRERSRQLALSLVALGEDVESTERQLLRWQFHPALCREAALWAWEHHSAGGVVGGASGAGGAGGEGPAA